MAIESQSSSTTTSILTSIGDQTLVWLAKLIKLLPSGTVFAYQFLSPLLSNYGDCNTGNKWLMGILLIICGLSCFFSCFTDCYTSADGKTNYGVATISGLWCTSKSSSTDLSAYKLKLVDVVHAFLSILVFGVVVLMDSNTVSCYYPSLESDIKSLLVSLPPAIGGLTAVISAILPSARSGIGYASTSTSSA